MKLILLCYHANISKLYPAEWIERFKDSIYAQTYQDFQIMEINYSGGIERIFWDSIYESKKLPTFVHAMNYLIKKALEEGADVVANSNVDDFADPNWLSIQLPWIKYHGYDLVSCNFTLIENNIPVHFHVFDKMDLKEEFEKNHNPVCHPAVLYSKRFLQKNRYVPDEVPEEDLLLWKRTIDNYRFKIVKENLLFHRIHSNAVCQSQNR